MSIFPADGDPAAPEVGDKRAYGGGSTAVKRVSVQMVPMDDSSEFCTTLLHMDKNPKLRVDNCNYTRHVSLLEAHCRRRWSCVKSLERGEISYFQNGRELLKTSTLGELQIDELTAPSKITVQYVVKLPPPLVVAEDHDEVDGVAEEAEEAEEAERAEGEGQKGGEEGDNADADQDEAAVQKEESWVQALQCHAVRVQVAEDAKGLGLDPDFEVWVPWEVEKSTRRFRLDQGALESLIAERQEASCKYKRFRLSCIDDRLETYTFTYAPKGPPLSEALE